MYLKSTLRLQSTPSRMPWSVCQSLPAMPHSQTPAWKPSASSDTAPNTSQIGHRSIRVLVLYRSLNLILYGRRVVIDYDAKCTDLCISSDSQNINGWLKQQKNSSHNKDINIETLLKIMHLRYMTLALWIYICSSVIYPTSTTVCKKNTFLCLT